MIGRSISIDIDTDKPFSALKTYFNMAHFFEKVFVRVSAIKGEHLWAIVRQNLSLEELCSLRLAFGDDIGRVGFDIRKDIYGKPKQVLFTKKKGKSAGKFRMGWKYIPKPFKNSHIPPAKYRS